MKKIICCGWILVAMTGCLNDQPVQFKGSVTVHRNNGQIERVTVQLPTKGLDSHSEFVLEDRQSVSDLLGELENIMEDLKQARDQMRIVETNP